MTPLRKAEGVLDANPSGQAEEELCSSAGRTLSAPLLITLNKETEVWLML